MARFGELDDAAVEALFQGRTPAGHEDLGPLAELAVAVRDQALASSPEIGPALRGQIEQRPRVPPRYAGVTRRRLGLAGAAAAALMMVGVAATHNALPAAAQRFVSSAAGLVGLGVPRPDEDIDQPSISTPRDETGEPNESVGSRDATETPEPIEAGDDSVGTPDLSKGPPSSSGPPEQTPGGATPADTGTPGDGAPATPAVPPAHSGSGGDGGNPVGQDAAPGQAPHQGASAG